MTRSLLVLLALGVAFNAHAETVNCTPITSLPATLSTQGVYCLKQDLATAITSGAAINITVNNVTLDCNGYKLGGLAAGDATRAHGVRAYQRFNTVVRNCSVRGFYAGIWMEGGASHLVEDNRLEGNTYAGIGVYSSDGDLVRNNYVVDTGGNLPVDQFPFGNAYGVAAQNTSGTVFLGNTLANTHATTASGGAAYSVGLFTVVGLVEGNRITQTLADGNGNAYGIYLGGSTMIVRGNSVLNASPVVGYGIAAGGNAVTLRDNLVKHFSTGIYGGNDAGGNFAD